MRNRLAFHPRVQSPLECRRFGMVVLVRVAGVPDVQGSW
jgi:hypothetical protein